MISIERGFARQFNSPTCRRHGYHRAPMDGGIGATGEPDATDRGLI